jgi:predicted small lipoprotein YifL
LPAANNTPKDEIGLAERQRPCEETGGMHDLSKGATITMHRGSKALLLCALALTLALGGCGRRGALEVPEAPAATGTSGDTGRADPAGQTPEQQDVKPARHSFPLDFLIK